MATLRRSTNRNSHRTATNTGGKKYGWRIIIAFVLVAMLWGFFFGDDEAKTPEPKPTTTITQTSPSPTVEPTVVVESPVETSTPIPTPVETVVPEPVPEPTVETPVSKEPTTENPPANQSGDKKTLTSSLNKLTVAPKLDVSYDRKTFGTPWKDVDKNGCDTRNDILIRDFDKGSITYKNGGACKVDSGVLQDPYTGSVINFEQGHGSLVDIEHVVALGDAAKSGAMNLSAEQRLQFANDPSHLLAVDAPANRQKGDKDASEWLPSNVSFRCEYVTIQINIKAKYNLTVSKAEKAAIQDVIDTNC